MQKILINHALSVINIILIFICGTSFSADRYVATNGTDSGTCETWATAASNIQYAVDLAITPSDTVWVSNGIYCVTNQIMITNKITVQSMNGWTNTIVYADWPIWTTRCFYVSRTGTVDGFMITNGHYMVASNTYAGGGGALLATGTIQNCYFKDNICSNSGDYSGGGGVYISGNGTISNCILVTNVALVGSGGNSGRIGGGAIYINPFGNILACHIASNRSAGFGGSISCPNGNTVLISNCTFNANGGSVGQAFFFNAGVTVADCSITNHRSGGGSVAFTYGKLQNCLIADNKVSVAALLIRYGGSASNCTIVGNESTGASDTSGGGVSIDNDSGCVLDRCVVSNNLYSGVRGGGGVGMTNGGILRNCLIHHNTNNNASGVGGGVFLGNAAVTRANSGVINCTIVNNYSTNEGGGICALGPSNYIVNCVIAGNTSSSGNYPNVYHRDNVDANKSNYYYSCAITTGAYLAENQGNITNDPVFAGASAGNWRLSGNSPCVNTGTNGSWTTNSYDLDRRTRIRYGTVDMGAYECIYDGTIYKLW